MHSELRTWRHGCLVTLPWPPALQTLISCELHNQANCGVLAGPEAHLLALTRRGFITCRGATHRLNFQGVAVTAEEGGLGLEEGSGHTVARGRGDLLQPVLQCGDLGTKRKEAQVEGRVGGRMPGQEP